MTVDFILTLKEGQKLDFKRIKIKPADLLETVVSFANTFGGQIILGIADSKVKENRLYGISEDEKNIAEIKKLISRDIEPNTIQFKEEYIDIINNKGLEDKICILDIEKSNEIVSKRNGDTFLRKGDQNIKIGASEIIKLNYERGNKSIESENSDISDLDCLDLELLKTYKNDNGSSAEDDWQFLRDQGLSLKINDKYFLTKGAILLFGKNPAVSLGMKNSIKISKYYGTDIIYTSTPNLAHKPITVEGPLIKQINEVMDYFTKLKESYPPKLTKKGFTSTYLIPDSVFREAITNAVIHRNYDIQDDIQVRFFDNRIEVESPGTYPRDITPRNIRTERFSRNKLIQRALNRFKDSPNLDIGEGVDRMFQEMKINNLYEPIYIPSEYKPSSVLLILLNENKIEYWDVINNFLEKNTIIFNSDVRSITGLDTLKASRLLNNFVKKGLLNFIIIDGNKRNSFYRRKDETEDVNLLSKAIDNENKIFKKPLKNNIRSKGPLSKANDNKKNKVKKALKNKGNLDK